MRKPVALARPRPDHQRMLLMTLALAAAILATSLLSGCNTAEGVGQDLSAAGHAVSDTAEDAVD